MPNTTTTGATVAQVEERWGVPIAGGVGAPDPQKEIVAFATACYGGVYPQCYDSHKLLAAQLVQDYGSNAWFLPTQHRMPLPDAPVYAVGAMLNAERTAKRKADWFLWIDDDVSVPKDLMRMLRASADPEERPYMATVAFIRNPPFRPAIWQKVDGVLRQWSSVPDKGVYEVHGTGLCAALFHRSLFDKVPEPWFATIDTTLKTEEKMVDVERGLKPDVWWCNQMQKAGLKIYVDCGPVITHFGTRMPLNRFTAPVFGQLTFTSDIHRAEREARGELYHREGCPVHACVRQGSSEAMAEPHEAGDAPGPAAAAGEPGDLRGPQADAAPRPELLGELSVRESPALWRGSGSLPWWEQG